jgi:hypothetical protein
MKSYGWKNTISLLSASNKKVIATCLNLIKTI